MKLFLFLMTLSFGGMAFAQTDPPKRLPYSPKQLKKLTRIDVKLPNMKIPRSYVDRVRKQSIVIMRAPTSQADMKSMFITKEFNFDEIESVTLYNRKRRTKISLIGSGIGAIAGVALGSALASDKEQAANLTPLGQQTKSGFFEPILGGFLGWGAGFVIGEFLSPLKLNARDRDFAQKLKKYGSRSNRR